LRVFFSILTAEKSGYVKYADFLWRSFFIFKGSFAGPIQHCSLKADCTLAPKIVSSFISRGSPHQAAREASTSEGRKLNTRILPAPRNLPQALGSFTCPKVGTWGRLFNFPSEGRHAEDFYI
jgi:hypothetical protein